jgi:PAS domain S-box-containing protein
MEVDLEENILYANQSFCEMSGYTEEELIGCNAKDLFVKGENIKLLEEKSDLRKSNVSDAYEIAIKNKRGDIRWWLISGAPRLGDDGTITGSIGIHLDITRQKRLEQELRKAKVEAEYSAQAKEIFLANMSHEIRTPMNAIMGMGKLLKKTSLNNQQRFYVDAVQNASENLLVIINDILDFSKIEAGKVTVEKIGFKLHQLLDSTFLVLRHKAEEKELLLSYHIDPKIAPILIGDPYRINQVLLNMLSNAIKFTEQGSITVTCNYLRGDIDTQQIRIDITDSGIGMSSDFISHLFEKFTQEDESVTRKYGGTGLGMTISKQLIELMGGTIDVKSQKGVGTTISIYFFFHIGAEKDLPRKTEIKADIGLLKGKKILLVEDNAMNRLVASTILKDYGAEIDEAGDGQKAIDKLNTSLSSYDLILMDVQMPVKDGIETTHYIRESLSKDIPIIALTANALKGEAERCLSAGMNDFISKPFEEDQLIQLIAKWLKNELIPAAKTEPEQAPTTEQLYDLSKLKAISRGNNDFVDKMIALFVEEVPNSMNIMMDGLNNYDFKKVESVAHRLKPSIQNMGIEKVWRDFASIEMMAKNAAPNQANPEIETLAIGAAKTLKAVLDQLNAYKQTGKDW